MLKTRSTASDVVARRVITRFVEATHRRCEWFGVPARRRERRFHRTWPLSVVYHHGDGEIEAGVALYNASSRGVAFLGPHAIEPGATVEIQLFCFDDDCPHVSAVVRHCTPRSDAFLVGCEFVTGALDG